MSKPGRNDPCYCGSGEKYKKCHMAADKAQEKERREMANAGQWLRQDFLKFARDERFAVPFAKALAQYWNDLYTITNAEEMSQPEAFRFIDWFVFDYRPEDGTRLIDVYYQERYEDLSTYQQAVLDQWHQAPAAGAYELIDYQGQALKVRDFLTSETFEVFEPGGRGAVERGDLLLGRLVPLLDRLEFSTVAAYLPQDEIADLAGKLGAARETYLADHPDGDDVDFMRRHGHLIIHHALEQAELKGRPPVAARDPNRADEVARKAVRQLRRLHSKL